MIGTDQAELLARAEAAVEPLRARAPETEQLGRLPEANLRLLLELGMPRLVMPREWGGYELGFGTIIQVIMTLARGCMSTAWCAALYAEHPWILAHFPRPAQAEAWGGGPDVPVSMSVAGFGTAAPVDGGYLLRGSWPFVSGCDHAPWLMLAARWGEGQLGLCLVPTREVRIDHGSWRVSGLRGTGSKTVSASELFVPDHRVRAAADLTGNRRPASPLYCQPFSGTLGLVLTAVAVGGAEGAFEAFRERIASRVQRNTGRVQAAQPAAHLELAEARARIDAARLLLEHAAELARLAGERARELEPLAQATSRLHKAQAARLCAEAVDRLFAASGGGALHDSSPLQRFWRDVHAVQAHAGMTWSTHAENYGSLAAGLGPTLQPMW